MSGACFSRNGLSILLRCGGLCPARSDTARDGGDGPRLAWGSVPPRAAPLGRPRVPVAPSPVPDAAQRTRHDLTQMDNPSRAKRTPDGGRSSRRLSRSCLCRAGVPANEVALPRVVHCDSQRPARSCCCSPIRLWKLLARAGSFSGHSPNPLAERQRHQRGRSGHRRSSEAAVSVSWNRASTAPTLATSRCSPRLSPPAGSSGTSMSGASEASTGRSPARRRTSQHAPDFCPCPLPLVSAIRPEGFSRNYQNWRPCRAGRRLPIRRSTGVVRAKAQGRGRARPRSAFAERGPRIAEAPDARASV